MKVYCESKTTEGKDCLMAFAKPPKNELAKFYRQITRFGQRWTIVQESPFVVEMTQNPINVIDAKSAQGKAVAVGLEAAMFQEFAKLLKISPTDVKKHISVRFV